MKPSLVHVSPLLAIASANKCVEDSCARVVAGCYEAPRWRDHIQDCSSYFRYTSTPVPKTVTATVTARPSTRTVTQTNTSPQVSLTVTVTLPDSTVTATVTPDTVTDKVYYTPTVFVTDTETPDPTTTTETDTTTTTTTVTETTTTNVYYSNPAKRSAQLATTGKITSPTLIPKYAGVCSGSSKYSSACSCLGVRKTTIKAACATTTKTVTVTPTAQTVTVTNAVPNPVPTSSILLTQPALTATATLTADQPYVTVTETEVAVTDSETVTGNQPTVTTTETTTETATTTTTSTATRSVGPVCSTFAASATCSCTFELVCSQQVALDLATFRRHLDFNTYVSSSDECMNRCDANPACQFGQYARLGVGGLCSSYSGAPEFAQYSSSSTGTFVFEKYQGMKCPGC